MPSQSEYVPGVCNIGPAEIQSRKHAGWVGVFATIGLWVTFFLFGTPALLRLLLFFPAMMAAVGFLQAAMHFCAAYGILGVLNFGPDVGKTDTVEQAEFRNKDRRKAVLILLYSSLVGLVVAILGYLLVIPS